MDQNSQTIVLINHSRTGSPTQFFMLYLSSWDNLLYKMHISFFKKVLIILRYSTKHANIWLGLQFSLKRSEAFCIFALYKFVYHYYSWWLLYLRHKSGPGPGLAKLGWHIYWYLSILYQIFLLHLNIYLLLEIVVSVTSAFWQLIWLQIL